LLKRLPDGFGGLIDEVDIANLLFVAGEEITAFGIAVERIPILFPRPAFAVARPVHAPEMFPKDHVAGIVDKRKGRRAAARLNRSLEGALVMVVAPKGIELLGDEKL